MAGLKMTAVASGVSLSASTAKTVIQVTAPTNQRVQLSRIFGGFYGVSGTDVPCRVRVIRQTSAGTARVTLTPTKRPNLGSETIQTTFTTAGSAEPTNGGTTDIVLFQIPVHPQGNFVISLLDPEGVPITLNGGERVGIEFLLGAAPSSTTVDVGVEAIE